MLYPSIDYLTTLADSKYTLVVAAARRARQLQEGAKPLVTVPSNKNVTIALAEIATKTIVLTRIPENEQ